MSLPLIDPNAQYDIHGNVIVPEFRIQPESGSGPNPHRLWDEDAAKYRKEIILVFEAEFDTFVEPTMYWGARDQFFIHNGFMYYYKPTLQEQLDDDERNRKEDLKSREKKSQIKHMAKLIPELDFDIGSPKSLSEVRKLIDFAPIGMPAFIAETPHFYQFISVGDKRITSDMLNKTMLTTIKESFSESITPGPFTDHDALYYNADKVYWTDLIRWTTEPMFTNNFFGIWTESNDSMVFNPFNVLSDDQVNFVLAMGALYKSDGKNDFTIQYSLEDIKAITEQAALVHSK